MIFDIYNPTLVIVIDLWDIVGDKFARTVVDFINKSDHVKLACGGIYDLLTGDRNIHPYMQELNKPYLDITSLTPNPNNAYFNDPELLKRYLKTKELKHIKNICIVGAAWDSCVENRPLGYDRLSKVVTTKPILIKTDLVHRYNETSMRLNEVYTWIKLKDDYLLLS
jgi:hypothetical protein